LWRDQPVRANYLPHENVQFVAIMVCLERSSGRFLLREVADRLHAGRNIRLTRTNAAGCVPPVAKRLLRLDS
jgi:hypothetical protein